jgi:riboflavin synthase
MFTGIIQEIGSVDGVIQIGGGVRLTIDAQRSAHQLNVNDSISINGACQTVVAKEGRSCTVVAVEETLLKTTLGSLRSSQRVNLELPLKVGDRLGGHIVSGHVDCVGEVHSVVERGSSWLVKILLPKGSLRYVIPVGSIAVDGVSLTVASIDENVVAVSIIPHTMDNTIFSEYRAGTRVNIEFDMIGKYIERLMGIRSSNDATDTISIDQMRDWGYVV